MKTNENKLDLVLSNLNKRNIMHIHYSHILKL